MKNEFLTFLKFNRVEEAENARLFLEENGIEVEIENERKYFDVSYAFNKIEYDIKLKIKSSDFEEANKLLEEYYSKQVNGISRDYYLFDCTNQELIDVIKNKYEWGHFNYVLAQKILNERNYDLNKESIEVEQLEHFLQKAQPKDGPTYMLVLGYSSIVAISILPFIILSGLPLIIGVAFAFFKKTLYDGTSIYYFNSKTRQHGYVLILLTFLVIIYWFNGGWFKMIFN